MQKNDLLELDGTIIRVLALTDENALIIDCLKRNMPEWTSLDNLKEAVTVSQEHLLEVTGVVLDLEAASEKVIRERYTLIASVLPFITDVKERTRMISMSADIFLVSKQTIRHYLCLYLAFMDASILGPVRRSEKELTPDQKKMRWALNKYYYSSDKHSLKTAYMFLLKEKYCDLQGNLLDEYPTYNQFRYFYRKTRSLRKFYISRGGIKDYQKNHRPLIGDGVRAFAPIVGTGMMDSTTCDIYLVNDAGGVVGRPILTACIDAYSSLCMGYSLTWEGGLYSLKQMLLNVISNKQEWCRSFGISIENSDWDCMELPSVMVTDKGKEYESVAIEQITELGIRVINLPSYRPELKGSVEKFFDLLQNLFKPSLKGKGIIEPDFQERGAHDYRLDACLNMTQFESIVLRCIVYYNTKRVLEEFPYTKELLDANVPPFASAIWNYGKKHHGHNLLAVEKEKLIKVLLPRTEGRFSREGLKVNGLRYHNDNYVEKYLDGKRVTVAYDPEDVSIVWVLEPSYFAPFRLIESRYAGQSINDISTLKQRQKDLIKAYKVEEIQGKLDMVRHIETTAEKGNKGMATLEDIRSNRTKERQRTHKHFGGETE